MWSDEEGERINARVPPAPPPTCRANWENHEVHDGQRQRPNRRFWMKGYCKCVERCRYLHPSPAEKEGENAGAQSLREQTEAYATTRMTIANGEELC